MATKSKGLEIDNRRSRHVGIGFEVVEPVIYGDKPTRGNGGHVAVATDGLTFSITLGGTPILNLNRADALALGIALIAEVER